MHLSGEQQTLQLASAVVNVSINSVPRVLERYPKNGKLLKCYGRFLEDCRNDFKAASRTYVEATRQVGGPIHS